MHSVLLDFVKGISTSCILQYTFNKAVFNDKLTAIICHMKDK